MEHLSAVAPFIKLPKWGKNQHVSGYDSIFIVYKPVKTPESGVVFYICMAASQHQSAFTHT
jgi:hypothetical protein